MWDFALIGGILKSDLNIAVEVTFKIISLKNMFYEICKNQINNF